MEVDSELTQVDRARLFWSGQNLDLVFSEIQNQLNLLQNKLLNNTASDKELEQSLKLMEAFDWPCVTPPPVVKVVIGSADSTAPPALDPSTTPPALDPSTTPPALDPSTTPPALDPSTTPPALDPGTTPPALDPSTTPPAPEPGTTPPAPEPGIAPPALEPGIAPPALEPGVAPPALEPGVAASVPERPPVAPVEYEPHCCSKSCVPTVPSMPQSLNPLNAPIVCGFCRLNCGTDQSEESGEQTDQSERAVVYLSPCGLRLCNYDDVMDFLLKTETYHFLQLDLFSFSPSVRVSPETSPGPSPGLDLSRGLELTPVELCAWEGERPLEFRYRRERWPRGCFLTSEVYRTYCDCRGRCATGCACANMTSGPGYQHQRLTRPSKTGIFECGPWCGCDPGLCQNRVVQRGLRVRLQVFRTNQELTQGEPGQNQDQNPEQTKQVRGWGVRCKDDLEQGTFVCVFAGVVLQRSDGQHEVPPPKQRRAELPSDDDIELVTEWLPSTTPNQTHVIQRGAEVPALTGATPSPELPGPDSGSCKRPLTDHMYVLDASREGNASRFFNHSCEPTLFLQNVFTDSHDLRFPNITFFTSRDLAAGTELTWDYNSAHSQEVNGCTQEVPEGNQEVPCACRSGACRERFYITDLSLHGTS